MQLDIHYYATCCLAQKAGIEKSELLAWADYFTDKLTKPRLHGIQTQAEPIGNWFDRHIQRTVLAVFHFLPGDKLENKWVVTPNCRLANHIIDAAENEIELGIALHTLQDTFSHQGWTGFCEPYNACEGLIEGMVPNVGHADMKNTPDKPNGIWTDPRTEQKIDNRQRAMACLKRTYEVLCEWSEKKNDWEDLLSRFEVWVNIRKREERIGAMMDLGVTGRFEDITKKYNRKYRDEFEEAAAKQLSMAI